MDPYTPTPSLLSGFLTGDTIQVRGETGDFQFSLRLDISQKTSPENAAASSSPHRDYSPETVAYSPKDLLFSSSSYATPIGSTRELEDPQDDENVGESGARRTRLRSGAIPPVAYFPFEARSTKRKKKTKKRESEMGVLERLSRRRSSPARPCSSYAFFVMANWGVVYNSSSSSSFGETSKRVAKMWYKLPSNDKKLYEEMALKDNARYKWQSELFLNNEHNANAL